MNRERIIVIPARILSRWNCLTPRKLSSPMRVLPISGKTRWSMARLDPGFQDTHRWAAAQRSDRAARQGTVVEYPAHAYIQGKE